MSKNVYMLIDTLILTALACALEAVNILLVKGVFKASLFSISLLIPMSVLVMVRWKWTAAITAVLSGLTYCLCLSGNSAEQYLVYVVGNLFIMLNLLWFLSKRAEEKVQSCPLCACLFVLTAYLFLALGRACMAAFVLGNFPMLTFLGSDAINLVMAVVIILIARRQKNLFTNQTQYLIKLNREREEQVNG